MSQNSSAPLCNVWIKKITILELKKKDKTERTTPVSDLANPRPARLESCATIRIETDSCTKFMFIVELFKSKWLISSCFSVEECSCLWNCTFNIFHLYFCQKRCRSFNFCITFIVATKTKQNRDQDGVGFGERNRKTSK